MNKRVGFCCKWIDHEGQINGINPKDPARELSYRSVTLTWMQKNLGHTADLKLVEIMNHNLRATKLLLERVASRNEIFHMVRLGSDILPLYTIPYWKEVYWRPGIVNILEEGLGEIGQYARDNNIRLSFHPGEYTVLASERPDVVARSIDEVEYHADVAYLMGYGQEFQDLKINVHIAGRLGAQGIIEVLPHLSPTAQKLLTIENDEMAWGIDESLKLQHHLALVMDVHHHWVKTGEYIQPDDPRVDRIIDSWRGVRPVIHYSQPRQEYFTGYDSDTLIDFEYCMTNKLHKPKLRAHSDFYWNQANNDWAWSFSDRFDIQTESKAKNLSQQKFVDSVTAMV
jgi:UV DNA damage repair endonuclease